MKKNFLYIALIAFFITAVSFVIIKYTDKQATDKSAAYPFLNRHHDNSLAEWQFAKKNAEELMVKIKSKPEDLKSSIALANAYITEARITGNYAYYDKAALTTISNILAEDPNHYEALVLKSLLQLSQHHFAEGLSTAEAAVSINPNNAFAYGLLVDANIEIGNYTAALNAADKMVTIRPDIRSYSRIAYLREIHGDYPGAIEAMNLAVSAGVPSDESTEWCRVQLGRLFEQVGQVEKAAFQYKLSLAARPSYANALHGLARIASHNNQPDSAIYFLEQASRLVNDIDIKQNLALAYRKANQLKKAETIYSELTIENDIQARANADDPEAGHYSDKEQAYLFIQQNNLEKALSHALAEYNRRPQNNDVNELMALVYYKRNEINKAILHIDKAMQTGSVDPVLLSTAGLIYFKSGDKGRGKELLKKALINKPVMPFALVKESISVLAQI